MITKCVASSPIIYVIFNPKFKNLKPAGSNFLFTLYDHSHAIIYSSKYPDLNNISHNAKIVDFGLSFIELKLFFAILWTVAFFTP